MGIRSRLACGRAGAGFTLAEVLAALLFMAIVIPVAVQALRIASLAGEVAQRKAEAGRVAERVLNENIIATNLNQGTQVGTVTEGFREFRWTLRSEVWQQATTNVLPTATAVNGQFSTAQPQVDQFAASQVPMELLTVEVAYKVQDKDYTVQLSTLVTQQ